MIIKLLVDGGEMRPGPAIAQKLGPIGINIGMVIADVNKATAEFKGTKVPVSLDVDTKTKKFKIEVSSPPTSELLKKEIGLESGSGDHKKNKVGHISIETIIKVAKVKFLDLFPTSLSSLDFDATPTDIQYFTAQASFKYTVYTITSSIK